MFMHGSWLHLIGNMLYLLIFGDQIEDRMGHLRFILFYLSAGLAANLAQVFGEPNSILPCVGASGAIAGVLGAYLVLYPHNRVRAILIRQVVVVPAFIVLGMWGVLQVLGQVSARQGEGGVAYMAHLGGLIAGLLVGVLLRVRPERTS
jgi:membrane associated rhomboid family serine protease